MLELFENGDQAFFVLASFPPDAGMQRRAAVCDVKTLGPVLQNSVYWDFPGGPVAKGSGLPMQGGRV